MSDLQERVTMLAPSSTVMLELGREARGATGSLQNPKKFKKQDFKHLRESCLKKGLLFEDPTFPADISSIGPKLVSEEKLRQIQWKRPIELEKNAHLIVDGVSRFDIKQGNLGDCWLLAALGSLTQQKQFLNNVLPKDQGFQKDYAGIFHFRFWQCGDWVDVVIDDRLPVIEKDCVFLRPQPSNEFWPCLLEKAYAKLRGSYQTLRGGFLSDGFLDLTGGVSVRLSLEKPPPDLEEILKAAVKSGCLMGCGSLPKTETTRETKDGIRLSHAYTITGIKKIRYNNDWERIIRLWNPWGRKEWKGPWSDKSPLWNHVDPKYREDLLRKKDDGEFWMPYKDLQKNFSHIYICNITPTYLDFRDEQCTWSLDSHINLWNSNSSGAVSAKPQYRFKVPYYDQKDYNVVISLTRKYTEHPQSEKKPMFDFSITTENNRAVKNPHLSSRLDVTHYFHLSPGTYTVVPTAEKNQKFEFLLRIFIKNQDCNENSNSLRSLMLPMDALTQNQDSSYKALFLKFTEQGSSIDASQLQQLLNEVILQDEMTSLGGTFSFDSCRGILALMDLNSNGRLTLQEFGSLWRSLTKYMDIFSKEDKNHSGFLDVAELKGVIQAAGLATTDQLLRLLALRYGDALGKIGFSDFVCCMLRLETMTSAFQNLAEGGSQISMTAMEWLTLVMYT